MRPALAENQSNLFMVTFRGWVAWYGRFMHVKIRTPPNKKKEDALASSFSVNRSKDLIVVI